MSARKKCVCRELSFARIYVMHAVRNCSMSISASHPPVGLLALVRSFVREPVEPAPKKTLKHWLPAILLLCDERCTEYD